MATSNKRAISLGGDVIDAVSLEKLRRKAVLGQDPYRDGIEEGKKIARTFAESLARRQRDFSEK